jgi:transposase InsO family protein
VVRAKKDADLRDKIEKIHMDFPTYGYRRIHHHLLRYEGIRVNSKKIRRVMKEYSLFANIKKSFKIKTTDSNHSLEIYPNLLEEMAVTGINEVWVADITYIRILTGFVYLAAIMDLYSRRIIGWSISYKIDRHLCLEALRMAIKERKPLRGCIHHSDRGVQYASEDYTSLLKENRFHISMSRKGNPYDNAFMESFMGILKREEVNLCHYETMEDVLRSIPKFIEETYNQKRIHSSLEYRPPVYYEEEMEKMDRTDRPVLIL